MLPAVCKTKPGLATPMRHRNVLVALATRLLAGTAGAQVPNLINAEGRVPVGEYHTFTIQDPKERTICAASLRERVLHHALMTVCAPALERAAVFDSNACRKGKGQLAAVRRAASHARASSKSLPLSTPPSPT